MAASERRLSASGVLGSEGRVPATDPSGLAAARLRLGGRPLPLVGTARVYVCGITPYDVSHLGHAATFVWADALASVARATGVRTTVVRNVTDVDDVLTAAAQDRGLPYDELALTSEFRFDQDMASLAVQRVDRTPRARAHVGDVVQLAAALLASGAAYERDGEVWLHGESVLTASGLDPAAARARSAEFDDDAQPRGEGEWDVPVWRRSAPEHPAWPSPWGWGRPGWHAECAAMAWATLGSGIDVLVGGGDLRWPHHAYQAAMVELAAQSGPFARARMPVGTVHADGSKMAKSTGNLVLVPDLVARSSGPAVRLMLLDRRWDEDWSWSDAALDDAVGRLDRVFAAAGRPGEAGAGGGGALHAGVVDRLLDDLDVTGALDLAEREGGAAARTAVRILRLG